MAKLPAQAEDTPKPVMCCWRLETSIEMSDDCAVPPPQVGLPDDEVELEVELPDELVVEPDEDVDELDELGAPPAPPDAAPPPQAPVAKRPRPKVKP